MRRGEGKNLDKKESITTREIFKMWDVAVKRVPQGILGTAGRVEGQELGFV